ncbi:choice-of-anchor D domain-containing protein [Flavobacterium amnicola]|uniref:Choice-of-anchor D domain-containing protein n=1 Tax=Flavobacterium amnicola TaxID=2506422 RepID=A0A4Q1K6M6_9FLAO|nr:choice-of-anchor D domain-containing protein [Flavobacterium amnicola]RXR21105.1 choice-of-anchor D domain-containing protein [Flavobacterium amnicola]
MKIKLLIFSLLFSVAGLGQVWTYDFGTGTGTHPTNTISTTFLTSTPAGGGTYRVRTGAAGGVFTLANPGTSLGTGSELQMQSSTSTATNKFGVYDWTTPSTVAYLKAKIRTTSASTGNLNISLGINTLANDNQGYTSHYNNSITSFTVAYAAGAISTITRRTAGVNNAVAGTGLAKDTDQAIEIYANNGAASTTYYTGGTTYTLNSQQWDLWVGGTKISPAGGWARAGTLASGVNMSGFGFFAESSTTNSAVFYIDDLEYSNTLPPTPIYTVTFNANGGTGTMANQTASTTTALTTNTYTNAGFTFAGWGTAPGGPVVYADGANYSFAADITLYAQWTPAGCTPPGTQASAVTTNGETLDGFNVNWTAGNGNGTMIVVSDAAVAAPTNGTPYSPNLAWGAAGQINTNNRVIFRGAGTTSGTITGLAPGAQYSVRAYEYNTTGNCYNVPGAVGTGYTRALEPTGHAATFTCTTASSSQINLSFSAASTITNAAGYILLQSTTGVPTGMPTDGIFHTAGSSLDANTTVVTYISSAATTYNVTGLTAGTTYYFSLIPYNSYLSVAVTLNYNVNVTIPSTNCTTTGLTPEINIQGNAVNIADGDTTPVTTDDTDFGGTFTSSNIVKTYTIQNTGTGNLSVTALTMNSGTVFTVGGITLPATIAPAGSTTFTVTFNSAAAGNFTDTVLVTNNDTDEATYNFDVISRAIAPISSCGDLFISEYIEGSSNNKAIEIYNPTASPITLTGNYDISLYANGSVTATPIALTGSVPAYGTFLLANSSAGATLLGLAQQTSGTLTFNGDDAVALRKSTVVIDVVGQIGFDPGTQWLSGGVSTLDQTLVRNSTIQIGDNDGSNVFNPSTEWTSSPIDTFSFLGAHSSTCAPIANIVLSSINPAVPAGNITQNVNNQVIYAFNLAVTNANAQLNSVAFTTQAGYVAGNVTNFQLWYSTDATFNSGTDTSIRTITTTLGPGAHTFTTLTQAINIGTTGYFFITTDLPCVSTVGNTITVSAITTADVTFAAGNKSGTAFAGGTQTIVGATPVNVTGAATSSCIGDASTVSWTAPTGCSDAATGIFVFVSSSPFTAATPTGNGGAYTANTVFGSGTAFDGGFCVYKGVGTTVTVTGLTAGTTYYYKIFTRNGLIWSNGVSVSCTPTPAYCTSTGNMAFNTSITNVTINTINNTTAKPAGYNDYTAISTNLQRGTTYPLSTRINTDGNFTVLAFAWIDFNHDLDFNDAGEAFDLGSATNVASGLTSNSPLSITIPMTATLGVTRMRVIATYDGDSSPCLSGFDGEVEDYTITITSPCTPTHSVVSFAPTSGPTATDVTITGTGFTAGTTVQFNGITATVVFVNATTIIATVPAGETTGVITVTQGGCNVTTSNFTQIKQSGTCTSGNNLTDLIISEVYDSLALNSWYMELYNPTGSPIDLNAAGANYKLVRYGDIGTTNGLRTVDISGIIPAGGIYLADLGSDSACGALGFEFVSKANGINENDEIRLTKNDITVDIVHCPNEKGYSITRNLAAAGPSPVFNPADWTTNLNESCANLDIVPFTLTSSLPTVNTSPSDVGGCGSSASFTVAATASGGGSLTYQWYYNNGISAGWTAVAGGSFAGVTATGMASTVLNLTGAVGTLNGYQFYSLVTQDGTCSVASDAAQLKLDITTWNGSAWSNGTPDLTKAAIINGNYNTNSSGDISCCNLTINPTFTLTVAANDYVEVQNNVINNGTFTIQDDGSLVQISNSGTYTGIGTQSMIRVAGNVVPLKLYDYVYWSSPVASAPFSTIPNSRFYEWDADIVNPVGFGQGNWISTADTTMQLGKGYIFRVPDASTTQTVTFTGSLFNTAIINRTINKGTITAPFVGTNATITQFDDNNNLVGNPYPSAIDVQAFIATNNGVLEDGSVSLWRHLTAIAPASSPYYQTFVYNYVGTDYVKHNGTASIPPAAFGGKIASGQAFFVKMKESLGAIANLEFRNEHRSTAHNNSQFFRGPNQLNENDIKTEKNRIWLDLVNPDKAAVTQVIAYVKNATNGDDFYFDAKTGYKKGFNFYSLINDVIFDIQARKLPFDKNDSVPLGVQLPTDGVYTIAINQVDGIFANKKQKIYVEDKLNGSIHDLTQSPYQFVSVKGISNDRFVLRFKDKEEVQETISELKSNEVTVTTTDNQIQIESNAIKVANYEVYNVLGQSVAVKNAVHANSITETSIRRNNQTLLIKIQLENGQTLMKKIIF